MYRSGGQRLCILRCPKPKPSRPHVAGLTEKLTSQDTPPYCALPFGTLASERLLEAAALLSRLMRLGKGLNRVGKVRRVKFGPERVKMWDLSVRLPLNESEPISNGNPDAQFSLEVGDAYSVSQEGRTVTR